MQFKPSEVENFQRIFDLNNCEIRNFTGCSHLELYQDRNNPEVFFTYSYWENEESLNDYRHSNLFKNVWAETKKLFSEKPEAWSVDRLRSL